MVQMPLAHATDTVTYEVVSDSISLMNVEYVDQTGRKLLRDVPLPWRLDIPLDNADGPTGRGAQVRADWRPTAGSGRWVVVSIYSDGKLLCKSAIDVGNATCYGNTPYIN
ncbi:MAG: hypothetical protein EKK51_16145 [Mycolicibacterium sp.]|nr:MAG: hypothetical protein EKK51_16145 [Mycolicibacterium sp.]